MITIGQYTQDGLADYGPEFFVERFLSICEEHRTDERSLLFAFLLYDFEHPKVIKVLQDIHYWNGLDSLSGSKISVFAFHSPADEHTEFIGNRLPRFNSPAARVLKQHFDLPNDPSMPTILFFQVAGNSVIGEHFVEFQADTIENTFNEINSVLNDAVAAVENVVPENYGNAEEIFNLVRDRLQQRQAIENVHRGLKTFTSLEKLAKRFAGLMG